MALLLTAHSFATFWFAQAGSRVNRPRCRSALQRILPSKLRWTPIQVA